MDWTFYLYFGVYLAILLGVVFWARKRESSEDFLISGRNRSSWQILLSKFAGTMGVSWFITYTAFAYEYGLAMFAFIPGIVIGYLAFAYWGVPRIYRHSRQNKFYTQGDYIFQRVKNSTAQVITELSAAVVQLSWLIAIIIGGGAVMNTYGFLSFELAVLLTTGIVLLYLLLAGFKAVIVTDVVQSIVIFVLMAVLSVVVLREVSLPSVLGVETTTLSFGEVIAFFIFSVLTMFGQADRFQLVYASKNENAAKKGIGFAFIPVFAIALFLLLAGMFVRSQFPGIDPSIAFTELLVVILPAALLPFGLIMFFAGLMSSADTYTFSIASHISFIKKLRNPVPTIRIVTVIVLAACAVLAIIVRDIVDMSIIAACITVAVSIPTIIVVAGVRSSKIYLSTLLGGVVAMVAGFLVLGLDVSIIGVVLVGDMLGMLASMVVTWLAKKYGWIYVQKNKQLKKHNTFGVSTHTRFFVSIGSVRALQHLLGMSVYKNNQHLILGGGSNVLFTQDFEGLVIKNNLYGRKILEENGDSVLVQIASGENWHDVVMWATDNGWGGIENLALIPGSVGATPVQNIGAYGVEIKETIQQVGVVDLQTGEEKVFSEDECRFGYRDSIFKNEAKGKYFIIYITLRFSKNVLPKTEYGAIKNQLVEMGIDVPTITSVRDAVVAIRQAKLPDPKLIGNAGSFFKNPIVTQQVFNRLQKKHSDVPHFETAEGIKIPAGWLIERCGWKGKRVGNVGVHENQALVIVNYGGATGKEIQDLAGQIQQSVQEKFSIQLEPEVTMI